MITLVYSKYAIDLNNYVAEHAPSFIESPAFIIRASDISTLEQLKEALDSYSSVTDGTVIVENLQVYADSAISMLVEALPTIALTNKVYLTVRGTSNSIPTPLQSLDCTIVKL